MFSTISLSGHQSSRVWGLSAAVYQQWDTLLIISNSAIFIPGSEFHYLNYRFHTHQEGPALARTWIPVPLQTTLVGMSSLRREVRP